MKKSFGLNLIVTAMTSSLLFGCGDATTTVVQQQSIVVEEDESSHSDDDSYTIDSSGRLAVLSAQTNDAMIYDLDDNDLLNTFALTYDSNTLSASAGYRYAIIANRSNDYVGFIDGGLWREDHTEHLHDYAQSPAMSGYEVNGSRPTHIIKHDSQTAFFFDGDATTGALSSVKVVSDTDISSQLEDVATLEYEINMHGVAEPKGDYLIASVRRSDDESTSVAKVLPDQVGVYHLHDSQYEQEQVFDTLCPDLHGAGQSNDYVVFGCSDGALIVTQNDASFSAVKSENIAILDGTRIGTIYGDEYSDSLIGVASGHDGSGAILVSINPVANEMTALEWQPDSQTTVLAYGFSYQAQYFLALDNTGVLHVLAAHEHAGELNWEQAATLATSEQDLTAMPDNASFSMAIAKNEHSVYISDPIAQHVLKVDLDTMTVVDDIELDFVASSIVWLGIE